jgi:hypothetical protein
VTKTFCGSRAVAEEDTMNLVNSKDIVADRVRDIQAQAATVGRARQVRGAGRAGGARSASHAGSARRGLAAWAGALARSLRTIETVEEL